MLTTLLATKLYIPPARPNRVSRSRLIEQLNILRPVTLIAAPAGFGKTTLLSDWIPQSEHCVTWLSIDEDDNDPIRFWVYVVAALQKLRTNLGESTLTLLQSSQPSPIKTVLSILINDISSFADHFFIALDDYHLIKTQAIHEGLTFLLEHLPPQMHIILTTRADPPLPFARLRARNQLAELRADELRFTSQETAVFLNEAMGLRLLADDIAALESRTEGWVAGLQLAAISILGRNDTSAFIQSFSGSHRHILTYLAEEVLERQSEGTLNFLLQTSVLDRLCGSLCDAVTAQQDGQATLEKLEHANLFIVPLDDNGQWYRYHHLFADVLCARLEQTQSDLIVELHRRASAWYEQNGWLAEAVRHAMAAQDYVHASRLIEQTARLMWQRGEVTTLQNWLSALPPVIRLASPQLCLAQAWSALAVGQFAVVESSIVQAEEAIRPLVEEESKPLRAQVEAIQSTLANFRLDSASSIELAHRSLKDLPEGDHFLHGLLAYNLGRAYLSQGDLSAASHKLTEAATLSLKAGDLSTASYALVALGAGFEARGRLGEAVEHYRQVIQVTQKDGRPLPFTAVGGAYVNLGAIMYEWNQLDEAEQFANQGIQLSRLFQNSGAMFVGSFVLAKILRARGDPARAFDACRQTETVARSDVRLKAVLGMAEAFRARLGLAQGNIVDAAQWATAYESALKFPASGDWPDAQQLSPIRDYEFLTLIRLRIAQDRWDEALKLLARFQTIVEGGSRKAGQVEVHALRGLVLHTKDQNIEAVAALEHALAAAEPEGFIRVFVDEGEPMREMLRIWMSQVDKRKNRTELQTRLIVYVNKLLAAYSHNLPELPLPETRINSSIHHITLVNPLTDRELEVLHLIAEGLSNLAIAQKLYLSPGTVKVHIKHIYGKLDVNSRTQAVARLHELNLQ